MTGLLEASAEAYHSDAISDTPTLSRSIAHLICSTSPAHARAAHPKLNPDYQPDDDPKFDLGTLTHDLFFGGPDRLVIVDADNWRTKAAQEERFQARVEGKIALLAREHGQVIEMVDALTRQLGEHTADPPLFAEGKAEQTLVWEEAGGVLCRARLDWLRDDFRTIDDMKTSSRIAGANPRVFSKTIFSMGLDLQVAAYTRAVESIHGRTPEFRFVVIETDPPYAMSVVSLAGDAMTLALRKWDHAVALWARCLKSGEWPAYDGRIAYAHAPAWHEAEWLERELEVAA